MNELQYIPLKDPSGATCGHARVRDGFLEFLLRQPVAGEALVLTGSGAATNASVGRIPVSEPVAAAALHDGGRLLCYGVSRDAHITLEELRRRVMCVRTRPIAKETAVQSPLSIINRSENDKNTEEYRYNKDVLEKSSPPKREMPDAPPARAPVPQAAAPETEPVREQAALLREPEAAFAREAAVSAPCPASEPPLDAESYAPCPADGADCTFLPEAAEATLNLHGGAEDTFRPEAAETVAEEPDAPEPEAEEVWRAADERADSAAEAESFAAILRRADAVFRTILEPSFPEADPDPYRGVRYFRPATDWHAEVDALLEEGHGGERVPVPNPFPHIFPNARFFRVSEPGGVRLDGEWRRGTEHMRILAVPGSYSPQPPPELPGFNRFIRSKSGGFWVRVIP